MIFLKIGNTDVSAYINKQEYAVNKVDLYETWTDGNWVTHREVTRQKVTGELQVGFAKATDFTNFQTLLSSTMQTGGYYPISAYCQNTGTLEEVNAYLDIEGEAKWDFKNSRQWQVLTIKVEER